MSIDLVCIVVARHALTHAHIHIHLRWFLAHKVILSDCYREFEHFQRDFSQQKSNTNFGQLSSDDGADETNQRFPSKFCVNVCFCLCMSPNDRMCARLNTSCGYFFFLIHFTISMHMHHPRIHTFFIFYLVSILPFRFWLFQWDEICTIGNYFVWKVQTLWIGHIFDFASVPLSFRLLSFNFDINMGIRWWSEHFSCNFSLLNWSK